MKRHESIDRELARRRNPMRPARACMLLLASIGLVGCPASQEMAEGGISGTSFARGPITALGSIFVTDVRWLLDDATIIVDGEPASEAALQVGMVVRVQGDLAGDGRTGRASRVEFDDDVEGPIERAPVDLPSGVERRIRVLGVDVIVHASDTEFDDGASFDGLDEDDVVEISGLSDGKGGIRATRVEGRGRARPGSTEVELHGIVENLSKNADGSGIFDLGSVTIRYDADTDFDDLSRESLGEGLLVEVEGTLRRDGEIDADEIEAEDDDFMDDDRDDVSLDGIVSGFTDLDEPFEVDGVPIDGRTARLVPAGLQLEDGLRVEVRGALAGGQLVADEIRFGSDPDDFDCDDDFTSGSEGWRLDNVKVPEDETCGLFAVVVEGNVQAEEGGSTLILLDSFVDGDVQVDEARAARIEGNQVGGNIQAKETRRGDDNTIERNVVDGDIQVEENEAFYSIVGNEAGGNLQVDENTGGVDMLDNTVDGDIQCTENDPDPNASGNTAGGDLECDD